MSVQLSDLITAVNASLRNYLEVASASATGDGTTTSWRLPHQNVSNVTCHVSDVDDAGTYDPQTGWYTCASAPADQAAVEWSYNYRKWEDDLVTRAVNLGINALFPYFWVASVDSDTATVSGTYEYNCPTGTEQVRKLDFRSTASDPWKRLARSRYVCDRSGETYTIRFYSDIGNGQLRMHTIKRPSELVYSTDTLEDDALVPARAKEPIVAWACYWLLTEMQAPRVTVDTAALTQDSSPLSPRQINDAANSFLTQFQFMLMSMRMHPWSQS